MMHNYCTIHVNKENNFIVLMLPIILQLVGPHLAAYDALYQQIDPAGVNHIEAMEAAAFLKRSALPDSILRDIWELADPDQKG